MVFYRKYRPQKISDLDNSTVRETLYSVLSQESFPHAFLFTGPKGLGKTSTARIVAKAINCERVSQVSKVSKVSKGDDQKSRDTRGTLDTRDTFQGIEPCNECNSCKTITNGSNMDILEIDAASNRGIDEIRDLREKIRLSPLSAKKKVYIIDEVHMLTTEAFNALLKTLEEPPAHVVFILCTTESHKVPATILSRCFHIQFTLATEEELKSSFKRIVDSEKIAIEDDALSYIAHLSDGSFRDGAKILEEVSLLAHGQKITKILVEQKYHITNVVSHATEMWEALLKKDTKKALEIVNTLVTTGSDIKYFMEYLTSQLHALLLQKVGVEVSSKLTTSTTYSVQDIKKLTQLIGGAYKELKNAPIPQLPLELAIIEWGESATQKKAEPNAEPRAVVSSSSRAQRGDLNSSEIASSPSSPRNDDKISSDDILTKLIEQLKAQKEHALVGLLRGCTVKSFDDKTLVIETKYSYHRDRLNDKKSKPTIERAVGEVTGSEITVQISLHE